jgi:hypothetical protein
MDLVKLFKMKFKNILLKIIQSPFLQTLSYYFIIVNNDKLAVPLVFFWIIIAMLNPLLHKLMALFFIFCPIPLFFKYSLKLKILPKMIFKGLSTITMITINSFFLYRNIKVYGFFNFSDVLPYVIFTFFVVTNLLALYSVIKFFINYFVPSNPNK